jgi:hypothetical protein
MVKELLDTWLKLCYTNASKNKESNMRPVFPSQNVQTAIQALNAAVRAEYGETAYASIGDGGTGMLMIGTPTELHNLVNGIQQGQEHLHPAPVRRPALRQRQQLQIGGRF